MLMSDIEKRAALSKVALGTAVVRADNAKVRIGNSIIHVRFCSRNANAPEKFKFNINPNTLSADYELWVCGSAQIYYLMPTTFMHAVYQNRDTYIDRTHPNIRVVSVDTKAHTVTYARGGVNSSLSSY